MADLLQEARGVTLYRSQGARDADVDHGADGPARDGTGIIYIYRPLI